MRHCGTQTLETPQLLLRRYTLADAPAVYAAWCSDPAVTRWLRWEPHKSVQETKALIEGWLRDYERPETYMWLITRKADGALMGGISAGEGETQAGVLEPGYCLGRRFWGEGYTTQALGAVLQYLYETVGVPELTCSHAVQNPASGRVMQKNGFTYTHDGIYHKFDGTPVPCRCYKQTKEEYDTRKQD